MTPMPSSYIDVPTTPLLPIFPVAVLLNLGKRLVDEKLHFCRGWDPHRLKRTPCSVDGHRVPTLRSVLFS